MARILVADDAGFIRRWAMRALMEKGHKMFEAGDGARAVKMYEELRPDLVLLDVMMPVMDGLTALREIRRIDPQARVAMLTAEGQISVVLEARKAGARDFVVKPCPTDRLLAAVEKALS